MSQASALASPSITLFKLADGAPGASFGASPVAGWTSVHSLATGEVTRTFQTPDYLYPTSIAFSPDARSLARRKGDALVWVSPTGTPVELETGVAHLGPMAVLALSKDGSTLASGALLEEHKIWLWTPLTVPSCAR